MAWSGFSFSIRCPLSCHITIGGDHYITIRKHVMQNAFDRFILWINVTLGYIARTLRFQTIHGLMWLFLLIYLSYIFLKIHMCISLYYWRGTEHMMPNAFDGFFILTMYLREIRHKPWDASLYMTVDDYSLLSLFSIHSLNV